MARISFCFLIVVVFAMSLMFDGTHARFTEKLTMSTEEENKNEFAKEILSEAEIIAILGVAAARNSLKEIMLKSDDLKCIPCGQNCISSRNCCSPCHCNFTGPVPLCTR